MSRADVDDFLAELDDVVDDWEGSADSATWAADGSHESTRLDGDYYAFDSPGSTSGRGRQPVHDWAIDLYQSPRRSSLSLLGPTGITLEVPPPGGYSQYVLMMGALLPGIERAARTIARSMEGLTQSLMTFRDEWPMPAADTLLFYGRHLHAVIPSPEVAVVIPRQRHVPHPVPLLKRDLETGTASTVPATTAGWRTLGPRLLGPAALTVERPEPLARPVTAPTSGPPQGRPGRAHRGDHEVRHTRRLGE